jgi:hypothetical protein
VEFAELKMNSDMRNNQGEKLADIVEVGIKYNALNVIDIKSGGCRSGYYHRLCLCCGGSGICRN